jgi:imidazoleglycerol phosphate dehydratase HisB
MADRKATVKRKTRETQIKIELNIDGSAKYKISTGIGFMNHMLELFAKHAMIDLNLEATGDIDVDYHHTVEDIGLALGEAFDKALGDRKGIKRYGFFYLPMDECLARVALDLGGIPWLVEKYACKKQKIRDFDLSLIHEFFQAFIVQARMNLHINQEYGSEAHHAYEAVFKGFARALRMAMENDPRETGVPSSKGSM